VGGAAMGFDDTRFADHRTHRGAQWQDHAAGGSCGKIVTPWPTK
jgi:hypothetical protein